MDESLAQTTAVSRRRVTLEDRVAELYIEAREDVYRYLLTLGLEPARAQEATQEVFLRLHASLRRRENIRHWRAWVFRVAHNLGLKLRARQQAQPGLDPDMEARIADPELNPELSLLERERMGRFHRAVEALSEQQRRCLLLRLNGLRYPEIGEVLGISASAVAEFLRRAIVRIQKGLP